jgi:hypothetical protein
MRVELLRQHFINDALREPGDILEITADQATPLMRGLDLDGVNAVRDAKIRVYGRWLDDAHTKLLDDPPIERTLEESQPVPYLQTGGPGR